MKFRALKDLPNGIKAGEIFDEHEDVGAVLMTPGIEAAEKVERPEPVQDVPRRRYQRRDLTAVED